MQIINQAYINSLLADAVYALEDAPNGPIGLTLQ